MATAENVSQLAAADVADLCRFDEHEHERSAAVVVLAVYGEVDMLTAPGLLTAFSSARDRYCQVVLDLTEVSFFSAAGAAVVATAHTEGHVRVYAPAGPARRVLALLDPHIPCT